MSDDGGFSPGDIAQRASDGVQSVVNATREFLGVSFEAHVCDDCNTACEATHAYDVNRAPEYGGKAPAWECPDCGGLYVREERHGEAMTGDMYGRE